MKDNTGVEIARFRKRVQDDFAQRNFGALEALAGKIIKEKSLFDTGSWKIVQFHSAITPDSDNSDADYWKWYDDRIRDWEAKYPESITARTVHIDYLTSYAWSARGGEFAYKVKAEAWPVFAERLAQAKDQITIASKLEQHSPMFWYAGFNVALGQGWSKEETISWFETVKSAYPDFWGIDYVMAGYLQPKWYGKEGEWEQFLLAEINRPGGLREEGYARIAFAMRNHFSNVFKESKIQWPLVRKGFLQARARYPRSQLLLNQFAFMAYLAQDRETASALFKGIGFDAKMEVWNTMEAFEQARIWAN
jgi:hypothetical protein